MKPDTYSTTKFASFPEHIQAIQSGTPAPPIHVQLILSDLCNEDCSFCAYRMSGYISNELFNDAEGNHNPNRMIPVSRVLTLIDEMKEVGVEAVQLTGGGEPTVHPQFDQILERLLTLGFKVGLVTNGVRLSQRAIELLACFPATWVRVSFDAASVGLYQAIRRAPAWHMASAIKNLSSLARQARGASTPVPAAGRPKLTVGAGFVVTKENWSEVFDCARMVKEAGADNLRISAVFSTEGSSYFDTFHKEAAHECKMAELGLSDEKFEVINMFGDRVDDLVLGNPDYDSCWYQYFTTYIGADQNVYRCCVYSYNKRGLIGSVKDQSFSEMWFARKRMEEMAGFDPRGCVQCQFNEKNRLMDSALRKDQSPHQSFV